MVAVPYIITLFLIIVCAFFFEFTSDEKRKMQLTMVAMGLFYMFFAFRGYINTDWISYHEILQNAEWGDFDYLELGQKEFVEPGFLLLTLVCKSIFDEYLFLQFVIATIDVILLYRFVRTRGIDNVALVLVLFFAFEGCTLFINLLRNSISLLIFLNALTYIEQRKPLQYFSLCLLALSFHTTAVIYFPLYFLFRFKINRWLFFGTFAVFVGMYFMRTSIVVNVLQMLGIDELLTDKVEAYTESMTSSRSGLSLGFFERVATAGLVFLYYDKLYENNKNMAVVINGLLLYFFMFFCLSEFQTISLRMSMLFVYSYWLIWIYLARCFFYENNSRLFLSLIMLYSLLKMAPTTTLPVQEYDNMLWGIKNYEERVNLFNRTFRSED